MGGNRAHIHSSKQMGGMCGAENLGRVAVSRICPEKLGKREGWSLCDTEGLSASLPPTGKIEVNHRGGAVRKMSLKRCVRILEPSLCEEAPEELR